MKGHENLKTIWFEGEMLPKWAQLLDLAARLCPVGEETRGWFAKLTRMPGVDDARTVAAHARALRATIDRNKEALLLEVSRRSGDEQPQKIMAAWDYALETIEQQANKAQTCTWKVDGADEGTQGDYGDGDITLRRV